jgi:O-antigen/teichoic acid export membrane protein
LTAGLAYALASAAASFLATPLLLRWLGPERLGAYRALTDWIGHLTYLELGLGGALMAALAGKLGQGDRAAVVGMLVAGLRAYWRVTLAQFVGGVALVVALPHLIALNHLSKSELRIAGAVALLPVVITPLMVFRILAETRQRSYLNWTLLTAQVLTMTGLSLLTASLGWGLIGQSLAFATAQVPTFLVLAWDGTRAYREVWNAAPDHVERNALGGLRWPTFVHGLMDRIGLVSDNIIIAWILGPAVVVPFFLTQQLAVLALSQLKGLGQATWAGLAELYAQGDEARLRIRLLELTGMVSGLGLVVLIPIAAYNKSFVNIWVGREVYAGDVVTGLACFNVLLWSIYSLWGWALLGTGHIRQWVPFAVMSTLMIVAVSVLGTATLGIVGPLLGTTSGLLLVTSWALPRVIRNAFSIPPWTLWRAALAPWCWGLPFAATLRAVASRYYPGGWLEFLTVVSLGSACGLALWWRLSLGSKERIEWQARLRSVLLLQSDRSGRPSQGNPAEIYPRR